jgi:hypothetical protein
MGQGTSGNCSVGAIFPVENSAEEEPKMSRPSCTRTSTKTAAAPQSASTIAPTITAIHFQSNRLIAAHRYKASFG